MVDVNLNCKFFVPVPLFYCLPCFSRQQFVAHPNVQQLLASIWYEGLPGFRRKNMALQALEIIRIGEQKQRAEVTDTVYFVSHLINHF